MQKNNRIWKSMFFVLILVAGIFTLPYPHVYAGLLTPTPKPIEALNGSIFLPIIIKPGNTTQPTPTPDPTQPPNNLVYYISPNGSDNNSGLSEGKPWATFEHAWHYLYPGDTLILLDGVYYQSLIPNIRNGKPGSPITIRAKNDGKAIIDGQNQRMTVQIGPWPEPTVGDYYFVEGIVARNSLTTVFEIWGSHNILRRVSGYNANRDTNDHVFTIATGTNNLIEDCIASGTGRKMVFTWGGENNVIRRCFANWVRYDARELDGEWPWGEDLELYNSSYSIIEDSISYGSAPKTAVSVLGNINSANGDTPYSHDNKILGVISIRNGIFEDGTVQYWGTSRPQPTDYDVVAKTWEWAGWRLGFGVILWGAEAEVHDTLFQDIFAWGNAGLGFTEVHPYDNQSSNMTINRATILNNGLDAPLGDGGIGTDVDLDQISHYAINNSRVEGTQYQGQGAQFEYQYINGTLMDGSNGQPAQNYWPWPMQNRVLTELGIDVTGELTNLLRDSGVPTGRSLPSPELSLQNHKADLVQNYGVPAFLSPVSVSISGSAPGATIRYTTDGSEPTENSAQYSGPITISTPTILKAKAFLNGEQSYSRSAYYNVQTGHANAAPNVEAYLLPFVSEYGEYMLPTNEIGLYGFAFDSTYSSADKLTTTWSKVSGPGSVTFANPHQPRTIATISTPGMYILRLSASDGDLTSHQDVTLQLWPEDNAGSVYEIPGRIEAENYKAGGEGIGFHSVFGYGDLMYRGGPVDVGYAYNEDFGYSLLDLVPGEWIAYEVDIQNAGVYQVESRVSAYNGGGVFHIELDGSDISGPISVPFTDYGMRIYTSLTNLTTPLPAGRHTIRIVADQASTGESGLTTALNYIEFSTP